MRRFPRFATVCAAAVMLSLAAAPLTARPTSHGFSFHAATPAYHNSSGNYSKGGVGSSTPDANKAGNYSKGPFSAAPATGSGNYGKGPAPASQNGPYGNYAKSLNPGSGSSSVATSVPAASGALGTASNSALSSRALQRYQSERQSLKTRPQPVDTAEAQRDSTFRRATGGYKGNLDRYYDDRARYMTVYRTRNPRVYVFLNSGGYVRSNYGVYDSGFMTGLLLGSLGESAANAMWAYSHEAEWQRYQVDALKQAQASNDTTTISQINSLQAQINALKAQNAARVDSLPPGVDASLAIAPDAMNQAVTDNSPTPGHGFTYYLVWAVSLIGIAGVVIILLGRRAPSRY